MPCDKLRYAWAVGATDFCLPITPDLITGMRFEAADSWHALEIHYDNPTNEVGLVDSSGITVTLVDSGDPAHASLDWQAAGYLWAGSQLPALTVPPGKKYHHVEVDSCSYPTIPAAGVTIYAFILHAHMLGRKMWVEVWRPGDDGEQAYLRDAACNTEYDFDLQETVGIPDPFTLYKDDNVISHCMYDSTDRSETTQGGDETENEMCIHFLVYVAREKASADRCQPRSPRGAPPP